MPTHKKTESERFKGPAKYAEYLLAHTVVSLLQRLPIGLAYRLGRGIGWLAWKTMKRRRATVRKNLEIVNAWLADGENSGGMMNDGRGMMNDGGESSERESGRRKKNAQPALSATENTNPSSFITCASPGSPSP